VFAQLLTAAADNNNAEWGLTHVDLSANNIGFKGVFAIEQALLLSQQQQRASKKSPQAVTTTTTTTMTVDLEGNLVFQEVMNGVTHGLGALLAMLGAWLLSKRVEHLSHRTVVSCAVYSTSLLVLYSSSTLYHSFFSLRNTKWIFEVMDKCAIYIVISGTYTPFLQIVWVQEPTISMMLLVFQWSCCILGITIEAAYPTWKYRTAFSLTMYLGMGWSVVTCWPAMSRVLPMEATKLMVLGGVAYTVGVPFFIRNNNLDHSIWHVFVLSGSIIHWYCIYFYVTQVEAMMTIPSSS
jgi:hemolysin III